METWTLIFTLVITPTLATYDKLRFDNVNDCLVAQSKVLEHMKPLQGYALATCLRNRSETPRAP